MVTSGSVRRRAGEPGSTPGCRSVFRCLIERQNWPFRIDAEMSTLNSVPIDVIVAPGMYALTFEGSRLVIGGLIVFSAQLALIVGLILQRMRRRRAEEALRRNEERYRSVVHTQSELICRFLPDSTLTFVNDAYCRFWGKTSDELVGRKFIELIPESARDGVLERIGRTKLPDSHEHQVLLPDGTIGWQHWINHAIVGERGAAIELQGVGRDITDRKRAEQALEESEARNSAMLRAIPDLMFVLSRDGRYVDYHARDAKLLFVPPSAFMGKTIHDVMPPD